MVKSLSFIFKYYLILIIFIFLPYKTSFCDEKKTPQDKTSTENKIKIDQDKLSEIPIESQDYLENQDFLTDKLGILSDRENLARRGEIIFFASFSYIWAYQFFLFDVLLSSNFKDDGVTGELSASNLLYSLATAALTAIMITKKDSLYIKVEQYKEEPYSFKEKRTPYKRSPNSIKFTINLINYNF